MPDTGDLAWHLADMPYTPNYPNGQIIPGVGWKRIVQYFDGNLLHRSLPIIPEWRGSVLNISLYIELWNARMPSSPMARWRFAVLEGAFGQCCMCARCGFLYSIRDLESRYISFLNYQADSARRSSVDIVPNVRPNPGAVELPRYRRTRPNLSLYRN